MLHIPSFHECLLMFACIGCVKRLPILTSTHLLWEDTDGLDRFAQVGRAVVKMLTFSSVLSWNAATIYSSFASTFHVMISEHSVLNVEDAQKRRVMISNPSMSPLDFLMTFRKRRKLIEAREIVRMQLLILTLFWTSVILIVRLTSIPLAHSNDENMTNLRGKDKLSNEPQKVKFHPKL